jgi:hypothetical protein
MLERLISTVELDLIDRVDARTAHFDDDGAQLGVSAHEPTDVEGLLHHLVPDGEELFLGLRKLCQQIVDEDVVGRRPLHELGVGKASHLFDEWNFILERPSELLDLAHHLEVPGSPSGPIDDVCDFIGLEVLAILQVGVVGRVVGIEERRHAVVDAGA